MEQSSTRFPVPHKKFSLDIKGNKTLIVICGYADRILVMATQIGSMGTILHARKEEGMSVEPTFNVSVVLGKRDEPMLVACARQLIEHISSFGSSRPLVLSLGLKDHSLETLKSIVSAVTENRLWTKLFVPSSAFSRSATFVLCDSGLILATVELKIDFSGITFQLVLQFDPSVQGLTLPPVISEVVYNFTLSGVLQ